MLYHIEIGLASHDELQKGIVEAETTWIWLEASSDQDAMLLACQFAHTTSGNRMVTRSLLLDWDWKT